MLKIFPVLLVFLSLVLQAKPKAYLDFESDGFFSPLKLYVDSKEVELGLFNSEALKSAFASDPKAQAYAKSAVTYGTWANVMFFGGLFGALVYSASNSKSDSNYKSSTYWSIFFAGYIPGLVLGGISGRKLNKAINQYNSVYETTEQSQWMLVPSPGGLGIAYQF